MRTQVFASDLEPDTPISSRTFPASDQDGSETQPTQTPGHVGHEGGSTSWIPQIEDSQADFAVPETSELADAAVATWGQPPPMRESLIGRDERLRITPTSEFPWRANAHLQILAPDNQMYVGTAWFVGPRTLITAGHCVYIHDHGGRYADWARAIHVIPGRDGPETPYGYVTSSDYRSVVGWARDQDDEFDYAAIILPKPMGIETGWLSAAVESDETLRGGTAHIAGYPGDKRDQLDGTLWYDKKPIVHCDPRKVYYEVDTVGGQSGSAVMIDEDGTPVAIGIHAYGQNSFGNSATRINTRVHENIQRWVDEAEGT